MTTIRICPAPNPSGRLDTNLWLCEAPRGFDHKLAQDTVLRHLRSKNPMGALDSMSRRQGRDRDRDLGESAARTCTVDHEGLRKAMDNLIRHFVPEDMQYDALSELDHHFGRSDDDDDDDGERENVNIEVEEGEDEFEQMPRNAREGGMGGRLNRHETDDRRRADDRRRRGAMDRRRQIAADSAEELADKLFGIGRIGIGGS